MNKILLTIIFIFTISGLSKLDARASQMKCDDEKFAAHKLNYFTFSASDFREIEDNNHYTESKFQFSARRSIDPFKFLFSPNKIFIAYTQKSFFQILLEEQSRPVRENNYNPDIFLRYCKNNSFFPNLHFLAFDLGLEHESNGIGDDVKSKSKSIGWSRVYLVHYWKLLDDIDFSIKHWSRIRNGDNEDYKEISNIDGHNEISFKCNKCNKSFSFEILWKYDLKKDRGGIEANLIIEDFPSSLNKIFNEIKLFDIHFQYWDGYGESLDRYNIQQTRWSIGAAYAGDYNRNE